MSVSQEQFKPGKYFNFGDMNQLKLPEITPVKVKVAYQSSKMHNRKNTLSSILGNVNPRIPNESWASVNHCQTHRYKANQEAGPTMSPKRAIELSLPIRSNDLKTS